MLERTAGCLETGSLRRLLPVSKKTLKSRRMLHSTFWNHGAMELELTPLWAALLRGPDIVDEHDELHSRTASSPGGLFLDFLYPSSTMKVLKLYSTWGTDRQENRRSKAGFTRFGRRLYTSLTDAKRVALDVKDQFVIVDDTQTNTGKLTGSHEDSVNESFGHDRPDLRLNNIIRGLRRDNYEEAWRLYQLSDFGYRRHLIPKLLTYLSTSNRQIDAERSSVLFEHFRALAGSEDYATLIRSCILAKETTKAIEAYNDVLSKFDVPAGSDDLLAYLLQNHQWHLAFDIWTKFQTFRAARPTLSYDALIALNDTPNLPDIALGLAEFVIAEESIASASSAEEQVFFASKLVKKALLTLAELDEVDTSKFETLLELLNKWSVDPAPLLDTLIPTLICNGHTKLAIKCYRQYRRLPNKKVPRRILNDVLDVFSHHRSILGMKQVLDDWFRYYGRPTRMAYRRCMSEFATMGDAVTVKTLFDQYATRVANSTYPLKSADDFAPLLHVHARRGELQEVLKNFKTMQEKFGIKPNGTIWNILINAHGKVHDVDGAFEVFQSMSNSDSKPDSHTFGTLMGICVTRGDSDQVMELYQMAEAQKVPKTAPMVDCVVLSHVQDGRLLDAEKVCEAAISMKLQEPLTRMWNYLLVAYGLRRDLDNTNRLLRRMKAASIDYDGATYSALMQALVLVKLPLRAYAILKDIMPDAGIQVKSYHYAIVMGGFLATREYDKVFQVYNRMLRRNVKNTSSTRLVTIQAAAGEDLKLLERGSQDAILEKAEQYFYDAYNNMDGQEWSDTLRKGMGQEPLDVGPASSYFGFMIKVYGSINAFTRVKQLYEQYQASVPEYRRSEPPVGTLGALMIANLNASDYDAVQQCWDLAFQHAVKEGQRINHELPSNEPVLRSNRFSLSVPLSTQILSLQRQGKFQQLKETVEKLQDTGFRLDRRSWNMYIQALTIAYDYKLAFELCENKLMPRWTGWAPLRWKEPIRNRLSLQLRRRRQRGSELRPSHRTMLYLAKAFLEIRDASVESSNASRLLMNLTKDCPKTIRAIESMQRSDNDMERAILGEHMG